MLQDTFLIKNFLAKDVPEELLRLHPKNTKANELYADVLSDLDVDETIIVKYQLVAAKNKGCNAKTFYRLGAFFLKSNYLSEAGYYLKKSANIQPNYFDVNHDLGVYYGLLKNYKKSFEFFAKAKDINKTSPDPFYKIACLNDEIDNYSESIKYYEECLKLDNAHLKALINLGIAYKELKKYDLAINIFQKAIEASPTDNYHII